MAILPGRRTTASRIQKELVKALFYCPLYAHMLYDAKFYVLSTFCCLWCSYTNIQLKCDIRKNNAIVGDIQSDSTTGTHPQYHTRQGWQQGEPHKKRPRAHESARVAKSRKSRPLSKVGKVGKVEKVAKVESFSLFESRPKVESCSKVAQESESVESGSCSIVGESGMYLFLISSTL